jgi:hypothetical protein
MQAAMSRYLSDHMLKGRVTVTKVTASREPNNVSADHFDVEFEPHKPKMPDCP